MLSIPQEASYRELPAVAPMTTGSVSALAYNSPLTPATSGVSTMGERKKTVPLKSSSDVIIINNEKQMERWIEHYSRAL